MGDRLFLILVSSRGREGKGRGRRTNSLGFFDRGELDDSDALAPPGLEQDFRVEDGALL